MSHRYELMELIRRKQSMSTTIVSKVDGDYAHYAGADLLTAFKLARIDTFLECGLIPKQLASVTKLYREYLNQRRKAFFASVGSTEITKLGFIQGDQRRVVSGADNSPATDRA